MRRYFLTGLAILLPVVLTVYVLFLLFTFCDNLLGRFINAYLGIYIPGIGLILTFAIIIVFGFFTIHLFGKKLFPMIEKWFVRLPLVKTIYPTLKQVINFIISQDKPTFKQVVLVEYPRKDIYMLGFVANEGMKEAKDKTKKELFNVFLPSSPGPLTGFFIMVPEKDITFLNITPEEAVKMIISCGVFNPKDLMQLES